jgi:hypothetical protein
MDRYGWTDTVLIIALLGGLFLAIIMDRYGGPESSLTIAFLGDL